MIANVNMRPNWVVIQDRYIGDCDELIVCNFDSIGEVIIYHWVGNSNKNTLCNGIGKWKIKKLK